MITAAKKENKEEGDKTVLGLCIQKSETFQFIHWMGRSLLPVQMGKKHSSRSSKIFVFAEEKKIVMWFTSMNWVKNILQLSLKEMEEMCS